MSTLSERLKKQCLRGVEELPDTLKNLLNKVDELEQVQIKAQNKRELLIKGLKQEIVAKEKEYKAYISLIRASLREWRKSHTIRK